MFSWACMVASVLFGVATLFGWLDESTGFVYQFFVLCSMALVRLISEPWKCTECYAMIRLDKTMQKAYDLSSYMLVLNLIYLMVVYFRSVS